MNTGSLLKRIVGKHWVWFWSGNWPLLDAFFERDPSFERAFYKIAGIHPRVIADFFHNGVITAYHCQEDYDRMEKYLKNRFAHDHNFLINSLKNFEANTSKDLERLREINHLPVKEYNNRHLARVFLRTRTHFEYNSAMDHYTWYIEKFFIPELENYLKDNLDRSDRRFLPQFLSILVTPRKPSRIYKERLEFFKLLGSVRKNTKIRRTLRRAVGIKEFKVLFPEVFQKLQKHHESYQWLPVLVNNSPTTLNKLWAEFVHGVRNNDEFQVNVRRLGDEFSKENISKKRSILNRLNPPPKIKKLISSLERTAYIRTEDNAVMSQSSFFIIPLYKEVARRLGVTYHDLKELTPQEIVSFLRKNKRVSRRLIAKRRNLTCFVVDNEVRFFTTGGLALKINKIISSQKKTDLSSGAVFSGVSASIGKAKGRARVLLSSRQSKDFKNREILVAPATSADFVPIMSKAAAIITQLGGLTSHAAVVSRELRIPCIVGVRDITSLLKTGDLVEVDAEKGIVRKI